MPVSAHTFAFVPGLFQPITAACAELEEQVQRRTFDAATFVIELKSSGKKRSWWMPRAKRIGKYLRNLNEAWEDGNADELRVLLRLELESISKGEN